MSIPLNKHQPTCDMNCTLKHVKYWDVTPLIKNTDVKYAVVILNRPITQSSSFISRLWNNATIRMTVDGGTTRWDTFLNSLPEDQKKKMKLPQLITGDFDSITKGILEKYTQKGCKIINTPDQNHTDFTKALIELNIYSHSIGTEMDYVIALCPCMGRLDQVLANIQTLYLARNKIFMNPITRVYLMSDDAVSWLLSPGEHYIDIPEETRTYKKSWCSLVPVGEPCQSVTTFGLKWNLDKQPLNFGGIVSTSNAFEGSEVVTIHCSHTLLWSMRIPGVMSMDLCRCDKI